MRRGRIRKLLAAAGLVAAAVAVALVLVSGGGSAESDQGSATPPNLIVITTDDQALSTFSRRLMPHTFATLVDTGVNFRQAIAAPPLCCPFRAGFLSGQYGHNNGVVRNNPGYSELRKPKLVLPAFLRAAGYRTGFVGKYLNGTIKAIGTEPAPGWDSWYGLVDAGPYRNARISIGGEVGRLPTGRSTTKALNRAAESFVREQGEGEQPEQPFFLWVGHYAPHPSPKGGGPCAGRGNAKATAQELAAIGTAQRPASPALRERDRSDKPRTIQQRGPLTPAEQRAQKLAWRCAAASLQGVDRGVARLVALLEEQGQLDDTLIAFSSDNGMNYGHHGLTGKLGIYEEMLRVPLVVKPPRDAGEASAEVAGELVSQVDLSSTLLDYAGVEPCLSEVCRTLDGRSLRGLIEDRRTGWPADRAIPLRLGHCRIRGMRTPSALFSRYLLPDPRCHLEKVELYDLERDPDELRNVLPPPGPKQERLLDRLYDVQHCTGIAGRDPEPPAGRTYCE